MEYIDFLSKNETDDDKTQSNYQDKEIRIKKEKLCISEYHRNNVLLGKCNSILPLRCIDDGEYVEIIYDLEGFYNVHEHVYKKIKTAEEIINLIKNILDVAVECEKWLMNEDDYDLTAGKIYISSKEDRVFFIFDPTKNESKADNNQKRICKLIADLMENNEYSAETKIEISNFMSVLKIGSKRTTDLAAAVERYISSETILRQKEEAASQIISKGGGKLGNSNIKKRELDNVNKTKRKEAKQVIKETLLKLVT